MGEVYPRGDHIEPIELKPDTLDASGATFLKGEETAPR
jgi:hypothetical protein